MVIKFIEKLKKHKKIILLAISLLVVFGFICFGIYYFLIPKPSIGDNIFVYANN